MIVVCFNLIGALMLNESSVYSMMYSQQMVIAVVTMDFESDSFYAKEKPSKTLII